MEISRTVKFENGIAEIGPTGSMYLLSQLEVSRLRDASQGGLHELFRRCALAVLNSGDLTDNAEAVLERYRDFRIEIIRQTRGLKLKIENAPESAFVDGEIIKGIQENLFSVLRDVVYTDSEIIKSAKYDLTKSVSITDAVFHILRNAGILDTRNWPGLIVCWGGHSVGRDEYDFTKEVGYQLGLRGLDICTGCGAGVMKGPMKGATIGHAKQRIRYGRYIGISEPGIIASESPNAIVSHLVITPDIEKRLEAFVRIATGIVVFPGGAGTAEEILYLLGILLNPRNADIDLPVIFAAPKQSADYFSNLDKFITDTIGDEARELYKIVIGDPASVAREMTVGTQRVQANRRKTGDAYYFNWMLHIEEEFQRPFHVSHESMAGLVLSKDLPVHELAANMRQAFSGIVAGNIKDYGVRAIREHGPFKMQGDAAIMEPMGKLLEIFVMQSRMKLAGSDYRPCYSLTT